MSLKAGIVGLPNVGKSTLFNAITNANIEAANYPFATIEPNVGVVEVPDDRLDEIAKRVIPEKVIPTTFEFTDIAGLVKGASKGEGLGNKFLANIREVDAICHVVRCFGGSDVSHVEGSVDPIRDLEIINLELIFSDLETVEKRLQKTTKLAAMKDKEAVIENGLALRLKDAFEKGLPARSVEVKDIEEPFLKQMNLLTSKPMIYIANVSDEYVSNPQDSEYYQILEKRTEQENSEIVGICANIEAELSELEKDDKQDFLDDLGVSEPGLNRLIQKTYKLLGLESYFTAGVKEVRAWTFKKGMSAPQGAGIIHSDFEKGFIRAEVMSYSDFINYGSEQEVKEAGKMRLEGKTYILQDGDIVHFRFNV